MNKTAIFNALKAAHTGLWDTALAFHSQQMPDGKWSVEQHVRHINKTMGGMARFLQTDKGLLEQKFGVSAKPSRTPEEIDRVFAGFFENGAQSPANFIPEETRDLSLESEISSGKQMMEKTSEGLNTWSEEQLDHQLCPHPLLGNFTVREMLYFSILHAQHHAALITKLLQGRTSQV